MDNIILWVDDLRDPSAPTWKEYIDNNITPDVPVVWVKSFDEFRSYLSTNRPLPKYISFDHDLGLLPDGTEKNGYDCAKYLIDILRIYNCRCVPECHCHSSNPVGKENILSLIDNYKRVMCNIDSD